MILEEEYQLIIYNAIFRTVATTSGLVLRLILGTGSLGGQVIDPQYPLNKAFPNLKVFVLTNKLRE